MTHATTARAREFAIRQAIGARPSDVIRALTADVASVILVGIVIGVGLLPAVRRALGHLIVDVSAVDLWAGGVSAGALAVGTIACTYWHVRRVGRVDLAQVMRSE